MSGECGSILDHRRHLIGSVTYKQLLSGNIVTAENRTGHTAAYHSHRKSGLKIGLVVGLS